jgi:small-conductance mechanosensitive channel
VWQLREWDCFTFVLEWSNEPEISCGTESSTSTAMLSTSTAMLSTSTAMLSTSTMMLSTCSGVVPELRWGLLRPTGEIWRFVKASPSGSG